MIKIEYYLNGVFQGVKELDKTDWVVLAKCLRGFGFEKHKGVFEYLNEKGNVARLSVLKPC